MSEKADSTQRDTTWLHSSGMNYKFNGDSGFTATVSDLTNTSDPQQENILALKYQNLVMSLPRQMEADQMAFAIGIVCLLQQACKQL